MKGFVYILSNPCMPGIVKVGRTTRTVEGRALELYQTGVPTPFVVERQVFTPECEALELAMHTDLASCRVNGSREFFRAEASHVGFILDTRHEEVVREWLDEFMPDHVPVAIDLAPDYPSISMLASALDVHFMEVVSALEMIHPDELRPALKRWHELVEMRRADRAMTAKVVRLG